MRKLFFLLSCMLLVGCGGGGGGDSVEVKFWGGVYRISAELYRDTCNVVAAANQTISKVITVNQDGSKVVVDYPGAGTFEGQAEEGGFQASRTQADPSGCSAKTEITIGEVGQPNLLATVEIISTCPGDPVTCNVVFVGEAKKQ